MKKSFLFILITIILITIAFSSAGCSPKYIVDSKKVIEEYYGNLNNGDVDSVVLLLDKKLLDSYGDKENFKTLLSSRLGFLGEGIDYEIVEATSDDEAEIKVLVETNAKYLDDKSTFQEIFELKSINNEMKITNIYLKRQGVVVNIIDALFIAYNSENKEQLQALFSEALFEKNSKSDVLWLASDMKKVLGEYKSYEILAEEFGFDESVENEVTSLYRTDMVVKFENGEADIHLEIGRDKSGVKILNIRLIPDIIHTTVNNYFKKMKDCEYDSILDMYHDVFYKNTEGGREGWREELRFVSEYGEYKSHQIVDWQYNETVLDDKSILSSYAVGVNAVFGDTKQYNVFKLLLKPNDNSIIYHTIEIEDKQ